MRDRYAFAWVFILLSGCGAPKLLSSTTVVTTQSPGAEVFDCAVDHVKTLEYGTHSIDKADKRLVARKVDDAVGRSNPSFRRAIDQLTIEVRGPPAGGATLRVIARSFHEHMYRRGPTLEEREASTKAKAAAAAVLEKCAPERDAARP